MSVPQVIDTNLTEDQAEANRGSCFNQKAADDIHKMVNTAELSWEDFLPALKFAHNTSYQSSFASTRLERVWVQTNNSHEQSGGPHLAAHVFHREDVNFQKSHRIRQLGRRLNGRRLVA